MKKNELRIITNVFYVLTITILVFSLIVSQDEHHLELCHEEHCSYCAIIHVAQIITYLSIACVIVAITGFLIFFFLSRLYKEQKFFVLNSLVFQKVQFNE